MHAIVAVMAIYVAFAAAVLYNESKGVKTL